MDSLPVGVGTKVRLNFSLALEDGSEVDTNFGSNPVSFVVGDGSMLPGFEEAVFGLLAGDEKEIKIPPEKGFGQRNPSNIQDVPRSDFGPDIKLEPGLMLSFSDSKGSERPGVVSEFDENNVVVDFNHPLAGRVVTFKVKIFDVSPDVTH